MLPLGLCGKGSTFYGFDGTDLSVLMPGTTQSDVMAIGPRPLIRNANSVNYTLTYTQGQPKTVVESLCGTPFCHASCGGKCWSKADSAT
jgi:hypothetical protein